MPPFGNDPSVVTNGGLAPRVEQAIRAVAMVVAIAACGYIAMALWAGWSDLIDAMVSLGLSALAGGAAIASLNYLLRFVRWHDLLRRMGERVPLLDNLAVYVGGVALTTTPGKVGETIRCALLLRWRVPMGASLAAFFIDRLTDLIGVLLLAAMTRGSLLWWGLTGGAFAVGAALRWAFANRRAEGLAARLEGHQRIARFVVFLRSGMAHYLVGWRLPAVAAYVLLALTGYSIQGLVFAAYVALLWPASGYVESLHIFATSTLVGAFSMLPGGLGAMEVALVAQLHAAGMPLAAATAAAVATRAVTLWFGILAGLLCLLWYRRRTAVSS